jgi:hypothetical protein
MIWDKLGERMGGDSTKSSELSGRVLASFGL